MYSLTKIHQDTVGESIVRKKYYGHIATSTSPFLVHVRIGSLFKDIILKVEYYVGCTVTFTP